MENQPETAPAGADEDDPRAQGGPGSVQALDAEAAPIDEVKRRLAARQYPHVTEDGIRARINDVTYIRDSTLTVCRITMANGFKVIGKAAPAHDGNYDPIVGERFAYEDAFRQLWPLEGYLLREGLYKGQQTAAEASGEAQGAA